MPPVRRTSLAALALLVALSAAPASHAGPNTECSFGGPTPGYRAIKLNLTQGTSFLTLELPGTRATRPVGDQNNWHLSEGIFVVNADTLALEAYRVISWGMAPRAAVVEHEGTTVVNQAIPAGDVPYVHSAHRLRSGLPAGSYYVLAYGTDGGRTLPNEWWSAGVQVEGKHACTPIGSGEVFDYDQSDFSGGTQVYVPGIGMAENVSMSFETPRRLVVGLIDAQSQVRAASDVRLDFVTPAGPGSMQQRIAPLLSGAGTHSFTASYHGYYPMVSITGLAIDLPA